MRKANQNWALVVSCHSIGYGIIRSLGERDVPVIAAYFSDKDMGYVSKYVRQVYKIANPDQDDAKFISDLIAIGRRYKGSVLFPSDDATLWSVARNFDTLNRYFRICCPRFESIQKIIDKKYTYECAAKYGVPVPATLTYRGPEDFDAVVEQITFPCIIKPRKSHIFFEKYGKKAIRANTLKELTGFCETFKSDTLNLLIQDYIPGRDTENVNYNSYSQNNQPVAEFTSRKVRLAQPKFGIPRCVRSEIIPGVRRLGQKVIESVAFEGYSCIEFKWDHRDEQWKLMEINGRHNRSGLLSLRCGINFPYIEYMMVCGKRPEIRQSFKEDIYWIDEFHDVMSTIKYFKEEPYTIREYITPYMKQKIFSILDIKDMKPFVTRIKKYVARLL